MNIIERKIKHATKAIIFIKIKGKLWIAKTNRPKPIIWGGFLFCERHSIYKCLVMFYLQLKLWKKKKKWNKKLMSMPSDERHCFQVIENAFFFRIKIEKWKKKTQVHRLVCITWLFAVHRLFFLIVTVWNGNLVTLWVNLINFSTDHLVNISIILLFVTYRNQLLNKILVINEKL